LSGLATAAPFYANLTLLLELLMGVGLLAGALLARLKRFRQHAWCQSVIVLVNLSLIVVAMLPSFRVYVAPRIPLKLGKAYYAVATAHAALGTLAEVGGLYILLAVGTNLLPPRLRIRNYKLWMRTVLVLWWAVLLLGWATYARWYVPKITHEPNDPTPFSAPKHEINPPRSGLCQCGYGQAYSHITSQRGVIFSVSGRSN
jgi:hypothetical protein